jgi:ketosteroid isomerase-like protein
MKQIVILTIALLIAASNAAAQKDGKNIEQEFIARHRAEEEAEAKRDIAALERTFGEDFIFIAANGAVSGKKKFLDDVKTNTEPAAPQKLAYENFRARAYGKTVMVNYVLVVSGKDKNEKDYANRFHMSVLWIKQKGIWRIANFQSTRVRS